MDRPPTLSESLGMSVRSYVPGRVLQQPLKGGFEGALMLDVLVGVGLQPGVILVNGLVAGFDVRDAGHGGRALGWRKSFPTILLRPALRQSRRAGTTTPGAVPPPAGPAGPMPSAGPCGGSIHRHRLFC